jgi:hypothetical protein
MFCHNPSVFVEVAGQLFLPETNQGENNENENLSLIRRRIS